MAVHEMMTMINSRDYEHLLDRIEALEAALRKIAELDTDWEMITYAEQIARAALDKDEWK